MSPHRTLLSEQPLAIGREGWMYAQYVAVEPRGVFYSVFAKWIELYHIYCIPVSVPSI